MNIIFVGYFLLQIDSSIVMNLVKEAVSMKDTDKSLKECVRKKFKCTIEFINVKARNGFNSKNATLSAFKYAHRFNHYRIRDAMMKK